jgi:hypothetical protein
MAGSNPCWEGRLPGLVGKNHGFRLAKTELENFKNWTQNPIIGSLLSGTWTGIFEKKKKKIKEKEIKD